MKGVLNMNINTNSLVPMTDANQNFSKVTRMVDENGVAVILKNNKPRYVVVDFAEYDKITLAMQMRKKLISDTTDDILDKNLEAFTELAK